MAEVERYQTLLQEKELLNQKWDEQNATLVEAHERVVQEITEELEAKLLEEQMHSNQEAQAREEKEREFEEVRKQLEEDADRCVPHLAAMFWTSAGDIFRTQLVR
jgi:cilia- and flagella-associated protein 57